MKKQTVKKSDRVARPYLVFQLDKAVRERLRRKTAQLRRQGKPGGSMQEFVEALVKKAV